MSGRALRRIGPIAAIILLGTVLSGCWSRHELNELAIVVGLGIDSAEGGYRVSAQIVNPSQVSTRNGTNHLLAPVVTFTENGKTVPEALRRMTVESSKRLYFSHLRMVIFGERLARAGIAKPLDFLSRESEMRNDFFLVVSRGATPEEILTTYGAMDPIPANNLFTKLATSDNLWAATGQITLDRLMMDLSSGGKSPALTGLEIMGDKIEGKKVVSQQGIQPQALMVYRGMAAFRRDKMVGWIDEKGTKALNYLQNSLHQTVGVQKCGKDGNASLAVTSSNAHIRMEMAGGEPVAHVDLRVEANVSDMECGSELNRPDALASLQKNGRDTITAILEDGVAEAQSLGADVFVFGLELHRQQPDYWHQVKDWNDTFRTMRVKIHPKFYVRKIGTIDKSVQQQIKE
ncbi:Ger(x)C family spore germination protein [Cohnella sp. REN36]|uniref:Ger(x)C family spore germination protein n=1 Tax=Cohnella sp. REN36 TaxID=2887347 RepID=UPI001D1334E0|nr:Ger(x)C family spore germination protein [Cohnella sp. REN36]MCC3371571.1 Ger(x)C family spore germination protein [Cohnella sp. REN36]